jgi:hypothetical protein
LSSCQMYSRSRITRRSHWRRRETTYQRLFRGKFLAMLIDAHSGGRLKFLNTYAGLADKKTFKKFLAPLRRIKWVGYCKDPFGGPEQLSLALHPSRRHLEPPARRR